MQNPTMAPKQKHTKMESWQIYGLIRNVCNGQTTPALTDIANRHKYSVRLVRRVIEGMIHNDVIEREIENLVKVAPSTIFGEPVYRRRGRKPKNRPA